MDQDIAHWTRDTFSMDQVHWKSALKLEVVRSKFLPGCKRLMLKRHRAGAYAQLVTMMFYELRQHPNRPDDDFAMT